MTQETFPAAGIRPAGERAQELTPGREKGQHSVWDALTNIFEDLDKQGGGPEAEELEDTLDELRGLLEMHRQLRDKAVELEATRLEVTRERDAAMAMLCEMEDEALAGQNTGSEGVDPFNAPEEAVGETIDPDDYTGGFVMWSGTSFAAPFIAGLLAERIADGLIDGTADTSVAARVSALEKAGSRALREWDGHRRAPA